MDINVLRHGNFKNSIFCVYWVNNVHFYDAICGLKKWRLWKLGKWLSTVGLLNQNCIKYGMNESKIERDRDGKMNVMW